MQARQVTPIGRTARVWGPVSPASLRPEIGSLEWDR